MNKPVTLRKLKTAGPPARCPPRARFLVTPDEAPDLRVPAVREIILSEGAGEPNRSGLYTSGPYTDPAVTIDVNAAPRNRTRGFSSGAA